MAKNGTYLNSVVFHTKTSHFIYNVNQVIWFLSKVKKSPKIF